MAKTTEMYNNRAYYQHIYADEELNSDQSRAFYNLTAEYILRNLSVKTVLDVGCATGMVVAGFRDLGIDAYGIDASEFAISQVREQDRPYVRAQDALEALPEDFPAHYDLVTCIEVAEHIPEELTDRFIGRLCELGDYVLFSSSPYDLEDRTHFNVQQQEYWCKRFAEHGYYRCMNMELTMPTTWTICFSRMEMDSPRIVEAYERRNRITQLVREKPETQRAIVIRDLGDGFDTAQLINLNYQDGEQSRWNVDLSGVKRLRFLPTQKSVCLATDITLYVRSSFIKPVSCNGIKVDEAILFTSVDPFIDFELTDCHAAQGELSARIYNLSQSPEVIQRLMALQEHIGEIERIKDERLTSIEKQKSQIAEKERIIERLNAEYAEKLAQTQKELRDFCSAQIEAQKAAAEQSRQMVESIREECSRQAQAARQEIELRYETQIDAFQTKVAGLIHERDEVSAARDAAINERDAAISERDAATQERDQYRLEYAATARERNAFCAERDAALRERDATIRERDGYRAAYVTAVQERDGYHAAHDLAVSQRDGYHAAHDLAVSQRDGYHAAHDLAVSQRDGYRAAYDAAALERDTLRAELAQTANERDRYQAELDGIVTGFWWKVTKPARMVTGKIMSCMVGTRSASGMQEIAESGASAMDGCIQPAAQTEHEPEPETSVETAPDTISVSEVVISEKEVAPEQTPAPEQNVTPAPVVDLTPAPVLSVAQLFRDTGNPIWPIPTVIVDEPVKRLNLVTDTIEKSSLLGGVATALIVATQFCVKYGYELRIITRTALPVPMNYENLLEMNQLQRPQKVSYYSDYTGTLGVLPNYKMDITKDDIFFATSWWSAESIRRTTLRKRFFYIIQEAETFFYNYGGERRMCEEIMNDPNIDFIINSNYLGDYFRVYEPNVWNHGIAFEPAFSASLYSADFEALEKRQNGKHRLFFYGRPYNPRNLFNFGVNILDRAIEKCIIDTQEWDICFAGASVQPITFCDGSQSANMGQMSWLEYAKFLRSVDVALCLMYTPHPSYPPYDVACSGGVVVTNRYMTKQSFPQCSNVVMADLNEDSLLDALRRAMALALDMEKRKENYAESTIARTWEDTLEKTMEFMQKRT